MDASRRRNATPREEVERELFGEPEEEAIPGASPESVPQPDSGPDAVTQPEKAANDATAAPRKVGVVDKADQDIESADVQIASVRKESGARFPGKGGPDHIALQEFIRSISQEAGFHVTAEYDIGEGRSVDVAIESTDRRIACEISVTTPTKYEMGNVRKALDAGFDTVLLVTQEASKLAVLKNAVAKEFPEAGNIHCILPSFVGDFLRMARGAGTAISVPEDKGNGGLSHDPKCGPIRTLIFELFRASWNQTEVAKKLNAMGHRTRTGAEWTGVQVRRALDCPSAIGRYVTNKTTRDSSGNKSIVQRVSGRSSTARRWCPRKPGMRCRPFSNRAIPCRSTPSERRTLSLA